MILFVSFILSVFYLLWLNKKGYDIKPSHELSETIDSVKKEERWKSLGLLLFSLVAILVGSELIVMASKTMIRYFGLSGTFFGMIILAFLVSIEEIARELPAALKGRAEISFGNVVGSIFAFYYFHDKTREGRAANMVVLSAFLPVHYGCNLSFHVNTENITMDGRGLSFLCLIFAVGGYFLF
ncbi:TPA: hypothetical protein ACPYPV_002687 [Legionella pneumophila]